MLNVLIDCTLFVAGVGAGLFGGLYGFHLLVKAGIIQPRL
jgi:hypothetical protein